MYIDTQINLTFKDFYCHFVNKYITAFLVIGSSWLLSVDGMKLYANMTINHNYRSAATWCTA